MISIRKTALLALGLFIAAPAAADPPFEVLRRTQSRPSDRALWEPTVLLATSPDEFGAIWRERAGRQDDPPAVDFRHHSVLLYFAGVKPTGGYRYDVAAVRPSRGALELHIMELEPMCGVSQTATFPMLVIQTMPWQGPVELDRRLGRHNCER